MDKQYSEKERKLQCKIVDLNCCKEEDERVRNQRYGLANRSVRLRKLFPHASCTALDKVLRFINEHIVYFRNWPKNAATLGLETKMKCHSKSKTTCENTNEKLQCLIKYRPIKDHVITNSQKILGNQIESYQTIIGKKSKQLALEYLTAIEYVMERAIGNGISTKGILKLLKYAHLNLSMVHHKEFAKYGLTSKISKKCFCGLCMK